MIEIKKEDDITILILSGEFFPHEMAEEIKTFYQSKLTLHIIFDLRESDMSKISSEDMEEILEISGKSAHLRKGGKTAFIISENLGFDLTGMYETYSRIRNLPITVSAFKSMEEAKLWIAE